MVCSLNDVATRLGTALPLAIHFDLACFSILPVPELTMRGRSLCFFFLICISPSRARSPPLYRDLVF